MSMLFAEGSDHLLKTFIWVPIYSRWFIIFLILYTFFNSPLCNLAPFLLLTQVNFDEFFWFVPLTHKASSSIYKELAARSIYHFTS